MPELKLGLFEAREAKARPKIATAEKDIAPPLGQNDVALSEDFAELD